VTDIQNLQEDTSNKLIKEIKGKMAKDLYAFRVGKTNTDLIFGTRQLIQKNWEYGKEFLAVFRLYDSI
jgi:hypothetical protein